MSAGEIHLSSHSPDPPKDSDFAIYIDFKKGEPNPQRVFQAADAIIRALQKFDETICVSIDSNIKPILMLEDIEGGSIKIWLKNILESVDDGALKSLDWRQQVGQFLVKAKYAYIEWVNQTENKSMVGLSRKIQELAAQTDVRHLPDYSPPNVEDLVNATNEIEKAKAYLMPGDRMSYITASEQKIEFDLSIGWSPEDIAGLLTKETVRFPPATMILAVKKPDYLGTSKWDLGHGKKVISVKIEDLDWLARFQNREVDVRPGDALRCKVVIQHSYGFDNELVAEHYVITAVEEVLENQYRQMDLFDK